MWSSVHFTGSGFFGGLGFKVEGLRGSEFTGCQLTTGFGGSGLELGGAARGELWCLGLWRLRPEKPPLLNMLFVGA